MLQKRMNRNPMLLLGALALGCLCLPANADLIKFEAVLGPEVAGATGSGFTTVTYDDVAQTLRVQFEFEGLSGLSTVAHIHAPTAAAGTGFIGVALVPGTFPGFPAGVMAGSYDATFDLTDPANYTASFLTNNGGTAAGAEAGLIAAALEGKAYLNIHSSAFPPGEIRGFLARVPDGGSTAALLGTAFLALAGFARRQKRPTSVS